MNPMIFENINNSLLGMDLESKLLKERTILLSGTIDDRLANIVIAELLYLDSLNHEDIAIYINSPGGSVSAGFAILDTMNYVKSNIITISIGLSASMAAILLASGTKGKRFALTNADVMIHQPLGGIQGQATEMQIGVDRINYLKEKLIKIIVNNSHHNYHKVKKDMERDYYMSSNDALKYGIIDKII